MNDFFTLSFRSDIMLSLEPERILLRSPQHSLTLESPQPGLKTALEHLQRSSFTLPQLIAVVAELDGIEAGAIFETELQKLIHRGWICHSVLPLATAIPIAENYQFAPLNLNGQSPFSLSRLAFLHQDNQQFVLESPLSKSKIVLFDWRVAGLVAQLTPSNPGEIAALTDTGLEPEAIQQLLILLMAAGMIAVEPEDETISQWTFHNLLFHRQTRLDRLDDTHKLTVPIFENRDRYPIVKPPMSNRVISLDKPDLAALAETDISLTQAIESRQSIREYGDQPLSANQLGEFLYRCARVKEVYTLEDDPMEVGG